MKSNIGIAGWPLRSISAGELRGLVALLRAEPIEIPKDLLDSISLKALFEILGGAGKGVSLAGTTDFAGLAGLSWDDYRRYLGVQVAAARFLGCRYFRIFLNAGTSMEMEVALARVVEFSREHEDLEVLIETHGGYESTMEGFKRCIEGFSFRFVVDFANIGDVRLRDWIVESSIGDRVAYFHIRNLGGYLEEEGLLVIEEKARTVYTDKTFLWEPKVVSGVDALEILAKYT